jgi:lipopolysaccharide export system protein LptC
MNRLVAARADAQTAHTYWTMGRGDTDRAFRAARKHSRQVRILRIAVPSAVVIFIGGFMLWTWLNPMRLLTRLPDNIGDLVISGTKITMEHPRLTGFTRDARPYELTAKAAAQDLTQPNIVELRELHAKFQMHDQSQTVLTAEDGIYDTKKEVLTLGKNTVIVSSSGYTVWLDHAVVDIRTSNVVTEKPVRVKMLQGTLEAKRLEVAEGGDLLRFEGSVKMLLNLGNSSAAQSPAGAK